MFRVVDRGKEVRVCADMVGAAMLRHAYCYNERREANGVRIVDAAGLDVTNEANNSEMESRP
jgi:uncharacterized protein YnzC (UPF0291/DUF896 family)